jgi:YNFM family putative membrane transporter
MADRSYFRLQFIVFALVSASFTNIYITQPVLPVLQSEFSADMVLVSFTVSAVILGIALSNLPFGFLADRLSIHPIILTGGVMVAAAGLICAVTKDIRVLIGARFLQGIFIPALTTCLAAYLAKALPVARLNVVMGSYVSATVLGGLGGRLLGGWIHPPLHWRYAFVSASILILIATFVALKELPALEVQSVFCRW